jgi:hypothetical protein
MGLFASFGDMAACGFGVEIEPALDLVGKGWRGGLASSRPTAATSTFVAMPGL